MKKAIVLLLLISTMVFAQQKTTIAINKQLVGKLTEEGRGSEYEFNSDGTGKLDRSKLRHTSFSDKIVIEFDSYPDGNYANVYNYVFSADGKTCILYTDSEHGLERKGNAIWLNKK
jgi:hypothetical protein